MQDLKRTEISQLGEFGLIQRLGGKFQLNNATSIKGIGDDAAVIDGGDHFILLSTDMLIEGIHFDLTYAPLQHVGYKAVASNVSDILAMNGRAEQIVISVSLSNRFSVEAVDVLYEGIHQACETYKVDLVGGDTSSSVSGLIIGVSVMGRVSKDRVVYRSGAGPGDTICVTGDLGGAYLGLQVLEREKQVFLADPDMKPKLEDHAYLVGRTLKPHARTDVIDDLLKRNVIPTSMIDISDGLSSELLHIATSSGVGFRVYEDKLPVDHRTYETALLLNLDPLTCALNGGDEYELLFTVRDADLPKLKDHRDIHMIGQIHGNEGERVLISKQGTVVAIRAQGWNHFSPPGKG